MLVVIQVTSFSLAFPTPAACETQERNLRPCGSKAQPENKQGSGRWDDRSKDGGSRRSEGLNVICHEVRVCNLYPDRRPGLPKSFRFSLRHKNTEN